jgi:hypothetical protein
VAQHGRLRPGTVELQQLPPDRRYPEWDQRSRRIQPGFHLRWVPAQDRDVGRRGHGQRRNHRVTTTEEVMKACGA